MSRARDETFMDEALWLAKKGAGWAAPNTTGGAGVVKSGGYSDIVEK